MLFLLVIYQYLVALENKKAHSKSRMGLVSFNDDAYLISKAALMV
jgi:hypothetical protein